MNLWSYGVVVTLPYGIPKAIAPAIQVLYTDALAKVVSPDGDTDGQYEIQDKEKVKNQFLPSNSRNCITLWMQYLDINKRDGKYVRWYLDQIAESSFEYYYYY